MQKEKGKPNGPSVQVRTRVNPQFRTVASSCARVLPDIASQSSQSPSRCVVVSQPRRVGSWLDERGLSHQCMDFWIFSRQLVVKLQRSPMTHLQWKAVSSSRGKPPKIRNYFTGPAVEFLPSCQSHLIAGPPSWQSLSIYEVHPCLSVLFCPGLLL